MKNRLPALLTLAALAACAGSPEPVHGVATPEPRPAAPTRDSFDSELKKELEKFTPTPAANDNRDSDALGQLRRAHQREQEILDKLRRSYDTGAKLPVDLVAELRQVRDELYEARWRILVEGTSAPLPAEMRLAGGGS